MKTRSLLAASCMISLLSGCGETAAPVTPSTAPAEAPKAAGGKPAVAPAPASTQQKPVE